MSQVSNLIDLKKNDSGRAENSGKLLFGSFWCSTRHSGKTSHDLLYLPWGQEALDAIWGTTIGYRGEFAVF